MVAVAKGGEPACEDIKHLKIKKREPYRDLGNAQVSVSTSPETDRSSLEADSVVFSPTGNVKVVDDVVDPEQEHMQESWSAVTDFHFGKIGDVQGFMSDAWTNLISSLKLTAWGKPMPRKPSKGPEKGFAQLEV